jgi:Gametolysin peptidase M11
MHELGHTLGLRHAAADGIDYADRSGYMGSGYTDNTWPRKCFNGYNSWKLGWYASRHGTVNPLSDGNRLVKLATFVDAATAASDEYVVLNIADQFYLVYNLARDFNVDTEQKKNQVTITQPTVNGTNSLAGLSAGSEYVVPNFGGSGRTLVIAACRSAASGVGGGGSEVMVLSIALDQSQCANDSNSSNSSNSSTAVQSPPSATPPSPSTTSTVTSVWQLLHHVLTR